MSSFEMIEMDSYPWNGECCPFGRVGDDLIDLTEVLLQPLFGMISERTPFFIIITSTSSSIKLIEG